MSLVSTQLARVHRLARRPATIYLISGAVSRLGSIALVPLYSRRLTPAEYGVVALSQSFIGLSPILSLGLAPSVSRFFFASKDREVVRRTVGSVCLWAILMTVAICSLLELGVLRFASAGPDSFFSRRALTYTLIAAGGSAIGSILPTYFRDSIRPVVTASIQFLEFGLTVGSGLLLVLYLGRGLEGALQSLAATYTFLALGAVLFVVFGLRARLDFALLRRALAFAIPYLPHYVALWLQGAADRWVMEIHGQGAALGPYALASQLSTPGTMAAMAWNNDQAAVTGEKFREGGMAGVESHVPSMRKSFLIVATVPSLAVLLGIPVLKFIVGARFEASFIYLPFLLVNVVVDAMYCPHSNVPYYASKGHAVSGVSTAAVALNVLLNILLIPRFGVWGAIVSRLVFTVSRTGAMWYLAARCLADARAHSALESTTSSAG